MSKNKSIILAVIVIALIAGAYWFFNLKDDEKTICFTVSNPTDFCRNNELVEIDFEKLGIAPTGDFLLVDSAEQEIPYQRTANGILFQVSLDASESSVFQLKQGRPSTPIYKVFARFVPERKDDFAWENDIAAYRMYGPALANENPSNGVDLWLKRTSELIVDSFYYREHNLGLPYHVDYGKGLDCYKVGHTMGCGGVALILNDSVLVGNHYDHWEIIEEGPLRTIFELTYDSVAVLDQTLKEKIRITVCAGSVVNRADVVYEGENIEGLKLAAGIFLHSDSTGVIESDMPAQHWMVYAEHAQSDAGLDEGRNYVAVVMPQSSDTLQKDGNLIAWQDYKVGDTATYYFGGGWSKWLFETDQAWFKAVSNAAQAISCPLVISTKQNSK